MVHNREQAARLAEASKTNKPGTCQLWTRDRFDAPSAGDQDGDKDADAVDGWKSEPVSARHFDRNPPRGVPVAFKGGSKGYGHRAVSLGGGRIRSTDMSNGRYAPGKVGTATIAQIEAAMGVEYLGWTPTISGIMIPLPLAPKPPVLTAPKPTPVKWSSFIHLDAVGYADYASAVLQAAKLTKGRAVDVDVQASKQGTMWALRWNNVGKNGLHDPLKKIARTVKMSSLSDVEIGRLRSVDGKRARKVVYILDLAYKNKVRIELDFKVEISLSRARSLKARPTTNAMASAGLVQTKTLAQLANPISRLTPLHGAGFATILSFGGYTGAGILKATAWPVTDYTRGTPKWR